jgi:1,4-alpha-glucan branching enzyme
MSYKASKRSRKIFEFKADDANFVAILGDFNEWDEKKHVMKKGSDGIWRQTLQLYPGTYEYKFMVDGKWINDPQNDEECINCFGSRNNILHVQ